MYLYIYITFLTLILYEYYIIYNIEQTQICNKCYNNTYVDNLQKLFSILLILIMFKFLVNNLLKDNLNKKQLLFIYILNLSIITVNILILYYINILIIQKDIIEKEYNIDCSCLISFNSLKILNNISLLISLFLLINLIIYIIALFYNDIDTLKYYNEILNKDLEIKDKQKLKKDDYKIAKINLPKESKKKTNSNVVENNRNNSNNNVVANNDEPDTSVLSLDVNNSNINTINTDDFLRNNYDISADTEDGNPNNIDMNNVRRINPNISANSQATEPDMYNPITGKKLPNLNNDYRDWVKMANNLG